VGMLLCIQTHFALRRGPGPVARGICGSCRGAPTPPSLCSPCSTFSLALAELQREDEAGEAAEAEGEGTGSGLGLGLGLGGGRGGAGGEGQWP